MAIPRRPDLLLRRLSTSAVVSHARSSSAAAVAVVEETRTVPQMPHFAYSPPCYDGPRAAEILKKRAEFLSPSMFYFYKNPLNVVAGKMQYLFDEDGRRYLDAFAGIATVGCGHCHPEVVNAIVDQTQQLQHSTVVYLNHVVGDFAEALASKLPGDQRHEEDKQPRWIQYS